MQEISNFKAILVNHFFYTSNNNSYAGIYDI